MYIFHSRILAGLGGRNFSQWNPGTYFTGDEMEVASPLNT